MERVKKTLHYLSNLEWTEKKQNRCIFCEPGELKNPLFENEDIIAVDNLRKAGLGHWLIIPKVGSTRHIRDCEALTEEDIPLLKALDTVKDQLLRKHFPNIQRSAVLAGFHRGRRHFHGPIMFPDIVSIHHLHLHIIIEPFKTLALFKYPSWFRFMWISDQAIMEQVKGRKRIESEPESRPSEPGCSADEAGA
ncbi:Histidine triad nucleotide-binding protein 3 [Peltigera leucophlebia]|nr:Histidine triad nucleotide-binding protein 3 [Peltigera leucophlebia]